MKYQNSQDNMIQFPTLHEMLQIAQAPLPPWTMETGCQEEHVKINYVYRIHILENYMLLNYLLFKSI